ncbi:LysR family transcriptional regulator [Jannaschia seohaensis]|uniref:DNA-binding transcriptional LysR family regulator n=1 Tax=Jannaschia seohaensis TaxID=475081 RepID=A0A2Y9ADK4_9RHOB|nr:LysR family transcriptional regulator [Jannaschia seohaensis]PWJ20918.1 DNA-binding transcriptional LysR family regulator [Jannaschia seohaensis]SSA41328.1 DNA-binding transcriptional regulator, LysR family [Jannaschia seohaensis]
MKIDRRNDLSLRLLEVFGTLMLHQTTVAAAEELGISQPSVSVAIKQLEGQVGFTLFEREKKRLIPTDDARILFQEIAPLFDQLRSVEARVRDLRGGAAGIIRIMATPPLGHSVAPQALSAFMAARPGVTIQYDVRRMENVVDAVAVGAADIGLCLGLEAHPGLDVQVLRNDRMVALMPADHPLARLSVVTPGDLAEHRLVGLDRASRLGLVVQTAFERARAPYRPQVEVRYCHTAAVLTQACRGVTVVDRYTASFLPHMTLASRPFDPAISIPACLVSRKGRQLSRLATEFLAHFGDALESGATG